MNIKDRVIIRDITKSILITAAGAVIVIYLLLPLVFSVFRFEPLREAYFLSIAPQLMKTVLLIASIVFGAQSLQYIRTYMFFGYTRKAAYGRVMLISLIPILISLLVIILASIYQIISLASPALFVLSFIFGFFAESLFFLSIGVLASSITTLARPPISVVLSIAGISLLFKLEEMLSEKLEIYSNSLSFIILNNEMVARGENPASSFISLLIALLALSLAFCIYLIPKSSMKSTAA